MGKNLIWIIGLWVILTAFNITKAFHIDDTFHLKAAQWISNHPDQPMSGMINWGDSDPAPFHTFNNPPLFFYLMAVFGQLFGYSELGFHLLESIFVFISLYFFDKLLRVFIPKGSNFLLVLFAFCPAFIINQNVMLDIPVLSMILGFTYFLIISEQQNTFKNCFIALIFLTVGTLIKYSILPLYGVFIFVIVVRKQRSLLWLLSLPISILGSWSMWNITEFGGIHLFRPTSVPFYFLPFKVIFSTIAFLAVLGAISFFSVVSGQNIIVKRIVTFVFCGILGLAVICLCGLISDFYFQKVLYFAFFLNGLAIVINIYPDFKRNLAEFKKGKTINQYFVIWLIVISLSFFIISFAPFLATRHVLLIVPFLLILNANQILTSSKYLRAGILSISIIIGVLLGLNDWNYANYYRKIIDKLDIAQFKKPVWTVGHWGWQWYSEQKGMQQYHTNISKPKNGDIIIFPKNVSSQKLSSNIKLKVFNKVFENPNAFLPLSGADFGSMYLSNFGKNPWTVSHLPMDTIIVAEIVLVEEIK